MPDWRKTGKLLEGDEPRPETVDALAAALPQGEHVLLAARALRFQMGLFTAKGVPTVVLTNVHLLVAKDKLFGKPKANLTVPLADIASAGYGPLLGVGPTWEVTFQAKRGGASMYLTGPREAEIFEQALRDAVGKARAGDADPDLAQLHRSLAMSKAQPDGHLGKSMNPEQVIREVRAMQEQLASGQLEAIWDRRVELGYGVPDEGVPQADYFWLNAAPALAALRLGLKDHPMVAMCCGTAEQSRDSEDSEQNAAVEEFNRLYFG